MQDKDSVSIDLRAALPAYIAVEGPIGVGKTTPGQAPGRQFQLPDHPESAEDNLFRAFLGQNRKQAALATQLFFLFQRSQKIHDLRQTDIFEPVRVADFLIEKDPCSPASTSTGMNSNCTAKSTTS